MIDAASGIAELLRSGQGVRVLVTSREALRVRGERLFAVPPLALPDDVTSADAVERSAAGRLFVERAGDARPGFELTDDDAEDVAEICGRLDGLPLAIELAAARIALFSPGELRDRLREHAGDMLSGVLIPMLDDFNSTDDPIEDYLIGLRLLEGVADDVDVLIPGHGSVGGADQVRVDRTGPRVRGSPA